MNMNHTKSILVVDDDDVFRSRLARAFRDRGFNVGEASNSIEAYDYVQGTKPKLIVLDLKLQNESGLVLLKELLDLDGALRVVVLTGYGTIATAVDAVKSGAVNYLTKPVDADTVLAAFHIEMRNETSQIGIPHLAQVEWDHIQRVIKDCDGNITQAAKALGMHRRSLQRKLGKNPQQLK